MGQLTFEEYSTMVRNSDPATSYHSASGTDRERGKQLVRQCLVDHPDGLTDYEISLYTGLLRTSAGKRRKDLGAVDTGLRRKTDTGSRAIVWRLP